MKSTFFLLVIILFCQGTTGGLLLVQWLAYMSQTSRTPSTIIFQCEDVNVGVVVIICAQARHYFTSQVSPCHSYYAAAVLFRSSNLDNASEPGSLPLVTPSPCRRPGSTPTHSFPMHSNELQPDFHAKRTLGNPSLWCHRSANPSRLLASNDLRLDGTLSDNTRKIARNQNSKNVP